MFEFKHRSEYSTLYSRRKYYLHLDRYISGKNTTLIINCPVVRSVFFNCKSLEEVLGNASKVDFGCLHYDYYTFKLGYKPNKWSEVLLSFIPVIPNIVFHDRALPRVLPLTILTLLGYCWYEKSKSYKIFQTASEEASPFSSFLASEDEEGTRKTIILTYANSYCFQDEGLFEKLFAFFVPLPSLSKVRRIINSNT